MCQIHNINIIKEELKRKFERKIGKDISEYILSFLVENYICDICNFIFNEGFHCSNLECDYMICDVCYNFSYGFNNDMKPYCHIHYDNHFGKPELKLLLQNYNKSKVKKISYKYTSGVYKNNIKREIYKYYDYKFRIPNIFIDHNIKIYKKHGVLHIILSNNIYDSIRLMKED